jgi:hypothetical protein
MNCHETRERLSGLLDDALGAPERAEVRAHLESCPECRRELDRLRAMVALLSRVERPRAPLGFVDRVMDAAHPAPWHRRLGRRLFLPLNIKLPVQAAAMLVIATLGIYLLQRTPELRDAARVERQTPASRSEPLDTTRAVPTPPQAPSQKDLKLSKEESGKFSERPPRDASEAENTVRPGRRLDAPQSSPPLTQEPKEEAKKEVDTSRFRKADAPTSQAAPPPKVPASSAPAPSAPPAESRAKSRDAVEGQSGTLAPEPPAMAARRQSAVSSVLGRLNVSNRPAAEQGLADILARLGGTETARHQERGATVVEVLVPEARYADFVRGLTTLGAWTAEGQPVALPTDPPTIRVNIRISE